MLITTHGHAISPGLYRTLPFDAGRDFAPITQIASSFLVLVAAPKVPATSVTQLLTLARVNPGRMNFGSTGLGAPPHLAAELLKQTTGIDARFFCGNPDVSELPGAYKNAAAVRAQITEFGLAEIVDTIEPVGCIMAGDWQRDAPWRKKKAARKQ